MAAPWMSCTEWLCCVHPRAYRIVPVRPARPVEQMISAAPLNSSAEQPQTEATVSGVIAGVVFLQKLKHGARVLETRVDFRMALSVILVLPSRFVIGPFVRVPPREVPVLEREAVFHDEGGVGVKLDVVLVVEPILERVVDESTEKRDIGSRANRHVGVGHSGGPVEAGIDTDQLRFSIPLGFHDETKAHGMVLGRVAAHDQNDVRIGDIRPAVGHRPPAERGGQTGHRGAVSETGLIFVGDDA